MWKPIETAPRDGTPFLAAQGQEVYMASWRDEGRALAFLQHSLRVESKHRVIWVELDGQKVEAHVPIEKPWFEEYKHYWCYWTDGFEFKPTHWAPIERPPTEQ